MVKYKIGSTVTFNLAGEKIRWCSVTSVKQTLDHHGNIVNKYDLKKKGINLYDIAESCLEEPAHDADYTEIM